MSLSQYDYNTTAILRRSSSGSVPIPGTGYSSPKPNGAESGFGTLNNTVVRNFPLLFVADQNLWLFMATSLTTNSPGRRDGNYWVLRLLAKMTKGFNVCHLNAQSLNKKLDEFKYLFEGSGIDAVCVSESWFHKDLPDTVYNIIGYKLYRADRPSHAGGAAIYVKETLRSKLIWRSEIPDHCMEYLFAEIQGAVSKILLGCVYRPNCRIDIQPLTSLLEQISISYNDIIIAGDFNSNLLGQTNILGNMEAINLTPVNKTIPTHYSSLVNTLIDIFFVLKYEQLCEILGVMIHLHDLYTIDWDEIYSITTLDGKLDLLTTNVKFLYDKHIKVKRKLNKSDSKPWFNRDIKSLITHRELAYRLWKRYKTPSYYEAFKSARRAVTNKIRQEKLAYYENKFGNAISSKQKWKEIRKIGLLKREEHAVNVDLNDLNLKFVSTPTTIVNREVPLEHSTMPEPEFGLAFNLVTQSEVYKAVMSVTSNALQSYVTANNLLTSRQSGFRPNHSCITALTDVVETIRAGLDNNEIGFLILLDHSKAFDSVCHTILTEKLRRNVGLTETATHLLISYLSQRSQYTTDGTNNSLLLPLPRGVPQGSILGPLLYSIYSNDLPDQIKHNHIQMYADDVQLYSSCKLNSIATCVSNLNADLQRILNWASKNCLILNPNKSKAILIRNRNVDIGDNVNIYLGSTQIEIVDKAKNLGVIFNKNLTWSDHISSTCGKVYSMLRNLWTTQHFTPQNIRIHVVIINLMTQNLLNLEPRAPYLGSSDLDRKPVLLLK
ncbi:uncharacterized protein LOC142225021 [Haematobia irritans]|uniref:uncharacterized protein LOC142225021 n=1 Tax=Haematobia irritans TaxID=7368 RepID=UPI003F50C16A